MNKQEVRTNLQRQVIDITPQLGKYGKGGYWWGVKIGMDTAINLLEDDKNDKFWSKEKYRDMTMLSCMVAGLIVGVIITLIIV